MPETASVQGVGTVTAAPTVVYTVKTGGLERSLEYELNRLAGTLSSGRVTLSAQAAANVWLGGGANYDLLGALNRKASRTDPRTFLGLRAVCNLLASTTNLDPAAALRTL